MTESRITISEPEKIRRPITLNRRQFRVPGNMPLNYAWHKDAKDAKVHFSFGLLAAHFRHPSRERDILHQRYPIPRDLRIRFLIYENRMPFRGA